MFSYLIIIIFLLKRYEAATNYGCDLQTDYKKIYECERCVIGYISIKCPESPDNDNCFICYKCTEIIYCEECSGTVCSLCVVGFYL